MTLTKEILLLAFIFVTSTARAQDHDIRMPPTIVLSRPTQVTYRESERITLECKATGAGTLTFEWTKNKMAMNLNNFYLLEVEGGGQTVIIKYAGWSDEGFYQCSVSSAYGKALSNTSHLQLASVGDATSKEISEYKVQEGQPFVIKAQPYKSFPRPTYSWEMATSTEDTSPRKVILNKRIQMDEDGNLHFAYATLDDSINGNIYKLITFNQHLDQKAGGSYTQIKVDPSKDGIRNFAPIVRFPQIVNYVGVVGRNISLRCFFGARPEATYVWRTPEGSKRFHDFQNEKTELFIRDIRPEDQGNYICSASNTEGRNELTLLLEVEAAPEFKTVKDGLQNINATEGDTVTFQCIAEGKPSVTTVWYMNGQTLDNNNIPRRMRFSNSNQKLTIENVCRDCFNDDRKTDLMVIQCNVSNVHGHAFSTGYLNILKKTMVTSTFTQDKVEVKKDKPGEVIFKCRANSDPSTPVSIEWRIVDREDSKSDYLVHPDNKVIFMDEPGQIRFNVQQNNTAKWLEVMGLYRCKANNSYSSDFRVMNLTVKDIPIDKRGDEFIQIANINWITASLAAVVIVCITIGVFCMVRAAVRKRRARNGTLHYEYEPGVIRSCENTMNIASYPLNTSFATKPMSTTSIYRPTLNPQRERITSEQPGNIPVLYAEINGLDETNYEQLLDSHPIHSEQPRNGSALYEEINGLDETNYEQLLDTSMDPHLRENDHEKKYTDLIEQSKRYQNDINAL